MGATNFVTKSKGKTAMESFKKAIKEAQWEHGHGGYTGTIAEKDSFIMIDYEKEKKEFESPSDFIGRLMDEDDDRISNKWGPAGCIKFKDEWVFFGLASE